MAGCQEVWDLENRLDKWVRKCPIRYTGVESGQEADTHHILDDCPDPSQRHVIEQVKVLERIWFERFAYCIRCGVPQKICVHWQEVAEGRQPRLLVKGQSYNPYRACALLIDLSIVCASSFTERV